MKRFKVSLILSLVVLSSVIGPVESQYWFQFGARGGSDTYYNNGAGVDIQTIYDSSVKDGSLAFWVGETLQNGAFLQTGYVIENQSGMYPTNCTVSACSSYEYIRAGEPVWFYEYFASNYNSGFLGRLGKPGSAGADGAINNYGFYSQGNIWNIIFNGNLMAQVDLGTGNSGVNDPVAFGEVAGTNTNQFTVNDVVFSNLTKYMNGNFVPLGKGYSYIGYGVGSRTDLPDQYGVQELNNRVNYFEVGSSLQQPSNNQLLWDFGYLLRIVSAYGNGNSSLVYQPYRSVLLSEPQQVNVGSGIREIFDNWSGKGPDSYTGTASQLTISIVGNITETANWHTQYLANVSSAYGVADGGGWYDSNATVNYSVSANIVPVNSTSRFVLSGWSNGNNGASGSFNITSPVNLSAIWTKEYFINGTSQYGNVSGTGWYPVGANITLTVLTPYYNMGNGTRLAFYSWSNGSRDTSVAINVQRPINIGAIYGKQYQVSLKATNAYGQSVNASSFDINNQSVGSNAFFFSGNTYIVDGANYRGQKLDFYSVLSAYSHSNISIELPLYRVVIHTVDVFGGPVNASGYLEFSNGTVDSLSSGSNGTVVIDNVPYARIFGQMKYLGLTEYISTSASSSDIRVTFVSATDLAVFSIAIIVSLVIYELSRRRLASQKKR
ncbi:MAG: hypothetical protein KGH72_02720 [Candidatus Micrarchaeota archaeon]|nr:hypothetical protein [Candidatus Micrarchaeota archaeon]